MRFGTWTRSFSLGVLALAAGTACGGDDGNGETPIGEIDVALGDGQSRMVGMALDEMTVAVTDGDGNPLSGITVTWSVQSGGGSIVPTTTTTDGDGVTSATATLGTTAGPQVVRAAITGASTTFTSTGTPGPAIKLALVSGGGQRAAKNALAPAPVVVAVTDDYDNPVAGATVTWVVGAGSGSVPAGTSVANASGNASTPWTLGISGGGMQLSAILTGLDTLLVRATATSTMNVLGGGSNVPERYGSDLWVADGFAYSGTWGSRPAAGNAVKIWKLTNGTPTLHDSIISPSVGTISDIEVSPDGKWLVFTGENGSNRGIYVYELTAPGTPVFRAKNHGYNLHTGTLSVIGGKLYAFAAKNPSSPALIIYDLSAAAAGTITEVGQFPVPANYGIHDTFVRDGLAFVFAWNEGVYILDVGNGMRGGSPASPIQISRTSGIGGETHNGWWFWNPANGEKKYLFIGEEGPGTVGVRSSGDIHVLDVSDLTAPREVAFFTMGDIGVHNFWMDEARQILYAAYYDGGVVALDVSGTLTGNLASREIARVRPGGLNSTYTWGVMEYGGFLYASDMVSGFWQLSLP